MKKEQLKKGYPTKVQLKKGPLLKKPDDRKSYFNLLALAVIILLGIIIYSNSFNCSFHFDDNSSIVNNPAIRHLSDIKFCGNFYSTRPIAIFTFALNYHFGQINVWGYHLFNLVIHLINACLVWWLTLLIFSSPALKDSKLTQYKKVLAFVIAMMFVSHPLATESVTYIVQRMASMAAMFYLLSVALYMKARLSGKGNLSKYLLFAFSFLSAILAIFTKENAFTLFFAILLSEFFFMRVKKLSMIIKDYRVILLITVLIGLIIIVALKFSFNIFKPIPPMFGHPYTVTSFNYLLTQFSVIVKYIQLLFLPINQMLDYNFPLSNSFFELRTLICFLVLLSLLVLAILLFKRNKIISFGIFWFFMTLSIESGFIPLDDLIFEHRTYLPSFGFFLILSTGVFSLCREKYKLLAFAIFTVIIGSNSYLTYQRNKVWENELSLWSDNILKAPDNARPYSNRGNVFNNMRQYNKAIADFSKAIEINPDYTDSYYNRGNAYSNLDQWDQAVADYSAAIRIDPNDTDSYSNRGVAFVNIKQWDKAISDFSMVIKSNQNQYKAYYNRGIVFGNLQKWDRAIEDYSSALKINPQSKEAFVNRGIAYGKMSQWNKAIDDYNKALEIDPNFTAANSNRETAYKNLNSGKNQ